MLTTVLSRRTVAWVAMSISLRRVVSVSGRPSRVSSSSRPTAGLDLEQGGTQLVTDVAHDCALDHVQLAGRLEGLFELVIALLDVPRKLAVGRREGVETELDPQQTANLGQQLLPGYRADQVGVRARFHPGQAHVSAVTGGQHDDGQEDVTCLEGLA